jgi:O-antigen biosynthesis protein
MQTDSMLSLVDRWYDSNNPEVSIVVLNWNKAQLTMECLKSLFEHTQGSRYEVIVVDNGSRAEEFALLSEYKGPHSLLRLSVNRFFGEGNNLGAELAKGEFVVFMNNDVTVTPNWLSPLVDVFHVHPECGAAGPKFVYPSGLLQEAGALLDEDGDSVQIGKFQDPASARFNRMRVVDYVSAACVVMRKKIFDDVLGFDFVYEPAYYEDVDLCLKIGVLGLKTFYVPNSYIVHHENATTADPSNGLNLRSLVQINRSKFVDRWTHFLKTGRHREGPWPSARRITTASDEGRPSAAIYTLYAINGGEATRHLFSIIDALTTIGYRVSLITPERVSYLRVSQIADLMGLQLTNVTLMHVKDVGPQSSFGVFIAIGGEGVPRIEALGVKSFYWSRSSFLSTVEVDQSDDWSSGYKSVIVSSDAASADLADQRTRLHFPDACITAIKPAVEPLNFSPKTLRTNIVAEGQFIFGAGSNRQDMMIRVFRRLIESGFVAELHLVGSLLPEPRHREFFIECKRLAQGLPVHFHVDASRRTLDTIYQSASVYWHGALRGRGTLEYETLGISAIEAMSAGAIPLAAVESAHVFNLQHGLNGFKFDSEDELVGFTQQIFDETDDAIEQMSSRARSEALRFSKGLFTDGLRSLLRDG